MTDASDVRKLITDLGADICGIADLTGFDTAPEGFRPSDVWSEAKSVAVYAMRMPGNTDSAESPIPYTLVNGLMAVEVDRLSLKISAKLDGMGIRNVIIPSDDPYEMWDENKQRGMAILSLRHAGVAAGLGKLGRNGLLINNRLGNMIQLGAVLMDQDLQGDPVASYKVCPDGCSLCIDECPVTALGKPSTNQLLCRPLSVSRNSKGYTVKKCWICRSVCPSSRGINNA